MKPKMDVADHVSVVADALRGAICFSLAMLDDNLPEWDSFLKDVDRDRVEIRCHFFGVKLVNMNKRKV